MDKVMKKKIIAVLLCLTMVMASPLTAFAMEGGEDIKTEEVSPAPTPEPATPTPEPEEPTATPVPEEPTATPIPDAG